MTEDELNKAAEFYANSIKGKIEKDLMIYGAAYVRYSVNSKGEAMCDHISPDDLVLEAKGIESALLLKANPQPLD